MKATAEKVGAFVAKHGMKDKEMREVLSGMGFKGLSSKITMCECAVNSDYFWSVTHKRWFPDSTQNWHDDCIIEFLKEEEEAAQKVLAMSGPMSIAKPNDKGPFTVVFSFAKAPTLIGYESGKGASRREVYLSAFRQHERDNGVPNENMPSDAELLKKYVPILVFKGKLNSVLF